MKMIVAADRNWGIGKNGDLLVHIPEDMEFFKEKTMGNAVVMGRKTFESFPGKKALPGRVNIVLTGNPDWAAEDAIVVHNMEELQTVLADYEDDRIYIIGGGQIYADFADRCSSIYVTHIDQSYEADTWFPNLEENPHFRRKEKLKEGNYKGTAFEIWEWTSD